MTNCDICAVAFDGVGTLIHPKPAAAEVYTDVGQRFGSRLTAGEIRTRLAAAFAEEERLDNVCDLRTDENRELRRWQSIVSRVLDDVADPGACFAELFQHFARPDSWRTEPDAARLLQQLRDSGYPIALASNYDHRLRSVLAGLESMASIGVVVISSEVGWRKPAPPFFTHLTAALGVPAHAVLYIGDDPVNDYEGARQAGMQAMLFDPRGRHPEFGEARLGRLGDLRLRRVP
jgi:putative hydrolase of the HAD superfamily